MALKISVFGAMSCFGVKTDLLGLFSRCLPVHRECALCLSGWMEMELVGRGMLSQEELYVCLVDASVSLTFRRHSGSRQCVSLLSEL